MTKKEHWATLSYYARGRTAVFASRMDQRFSYCCYIPASYEEHGDVRYPLTVLVHGSLRDATSLRDQFIDYAEDNQTILLARCSPAASKNRATCTITSGSCSGVFATISSCST